MVRTNNYANTTMPEQVFSQHKDMVYSIALATLQNTRDAEDITLLTFRETQDMLPRCSPNQIASQLLQIVTVESLRRLSSRDGGIPYGSEPTGFYGSEEDDFMLPVAYVQSNELKGRLMQAIDALPVYQRQALVMYIYNHLTLRATASAMRCSENAACAYLCSAKATVRQQLEELAYRNGEYYDSSEMIPFNRVYTALIAEQAMSTQVASYIWDALLNTVDRESNYAPVAAAVPAGGMSSGSKIALWMSAIAAVLVLVTACAFIGFSPKAKTKKAAETEVETVIVYETQKKNEDSSSSETPRENPPKQEIYNIQLPDVPSEREKESSSSPSKAPSSKSSSKSSDSSSSTPNSKSSGSSSSKSDDGDTNINVVLNVISGTYNEQKADSTDDFNTLKISSDGTVTLFSLDFMTGDNSTGILKASVSNVGKQSEGVYTFAAVNGDSPLSGTSFTYYSAGTPTSELPFSSAFIETNNGKLTRAVVIDSSHIVYK